MRKPRPTLAVIAPQMGALSETFIRRHMEELLPGRTVVVVGSARPPYGQWSVDCPTLIVKDPGLAIGLWRRVRFGRFGPARRNVGQLVRWFLTKHHVDIVLSEYLDYSARWLDIVGDLGVPFFAHAHGYDVSSSLRDSAWRETYLRYNAAAGVITPSALSRQRLIEIGLEPSKVTSIPYGVDVPEKPPHRKPDEYIRCIAIGRAVPKKGILFTLEAFRLAAADIPHLRLDVIGDGELLPAARQYVHEFALERNVTFHGAQPAAAVKNMLARTDIFLQHSVVDTETGDEEGLPVAILEAMAQAVPVVSTKHAGIPEAVIDGVTGFLVEERDSSAMSERIVALARDEARRGSIGEAGWRRARSAFSWNIERSRLLRELGIHDER